MNTILVSSTWLNNHLNDSDLIVLDASQAKTATGEKSDLENIQIPGARIFNLKKDFSLQSSDLPNMLPEARTFEASCRRLGINKSSKIVVYDNLGVYYSPRVWWMFKTMGHENIAVLDGGLPHWVSNRYKTEPKVCSRFNTGDFTATLNSKHVKTFSFVKQNIKNQDSILIDARSEKRFKGLAPEPREGLASGHIPNAINIPFTTVLDTDCFKTKTALKAVFAAYNIKDKPLVFSCGSGVTACIVLLASTLVLTQETAVYDGSWTEWAQHKDSEIIC